MGFLITYTGGGSVTYKDAVRLASTANVPLTGATPLVIDTLTVANKDRILLKDQLVGSQNGIYEVTISGGTYTLTRTKDADTSKEIVTGMIVPVSEGGVNLDKNFQLITNSPITVGVTSLVFVDTLASLLNKADRDLGNLTSPTAINQDLLFADDLSFDIGAASASRPQSVFVKTAINLDSLNPSQILASDISKNVVSLNTATYPSLTELSYVKGLTSSAQVQIDGKANRTLSNLTAPTAVNEDLNLNANKVLVTNGATKPVFTQSGTNQTDIVLRQSIITSTKTADDQGNGVTIASNAYLDGGTWKYNLTTNTRSAFRLRTITGVFTPQFGELGGLALDYAIAGNPNGNITWRTGAYFGLVQGDFYRLSVNGILLGRQNTNEGEAQSILTATDNTGLLGGSRTTQRMLGANFGTYVSIGHTTYNTGTIASSPGRFSVRASQDLAPANYGQTSVNQQLTFTSVTGNSGDYAGNVGDYVQLSGLNYARQITALNYSAGTDSATVTVDRPIGDGVSRGFIFHKPAILAFTQNKDLSFEVSYDGQTKVKRGLTVNTKHAQTGTITAAVTDLYIGCNSSGGGVTVNLPSCNLVSPGKILIIKDEGGNATTNNISIVANGSDLIDGSGTQSLVVNYESVTLVCNGAGGWFII